MPMVTRTRRTRLSRRVDMQIDSDVDMDEPEPEEEEAANVDIEGVDEGEGEDDENENAEEDEEDAEDEEEEDQIESEVDEAPKPAHPAASSSRFKIKLKIPAHRETPVVESEDSMSNDSQPSTSTRPMTTRQAVLASVLDSTHVSLSGSRQKKKPLNETELALRREETARKRKNLSEKKLEDEKAETINRLLKKQSRPRNKRNTAQRDNMDDIPPPTSMAGTRTNSNSNSTYAPAARKRGGKKATDSVANEDGEDGDDEDGMEGVEEEEDVGVGAEVKTPTMYRWVSSSRTQGKDTTMGITFSVPITALPPQAIEPNHDEEMISVPAHRNCAAPGCGNPMRYRLVKDWTKGACGIPCLKVLEAGAA